MRRLLLLLAFLLAAVPSQAAITFFDSGHDPTADDGANTAGADSVVITPPALMTAGQFVMVVMMVRATTSLTFQVNQAGGQNWHYRARQVGATGVVASFREFWCIFNGTWSADPGWTELSGNDSVQGWMGVWDGVDKTFPFDTGWVSGSSADGTPTTVVASDFSTIANGALAIVAGATGDNNTWTIDNSFVTLSGSGNVYWRCQQGVDNSIVYASRAMATAGAVGATTMTQATLGGDGGVWFTVSLRPSGLARRGILGAR